MESLHSLPGWESSSLESPHCDRRSLYQQTLALAPLSKKAQFQSTVCLPPSAERVILLLMDRRFLNSHLAPLVER